MEKVWLQDFRSGEIEEYIGQGNDLILVPVGSLEQHGKNLPLGTDSFVAIKLTEDAARKSKTISTPPLWFGWSHHHMGFSGTVTLEAGTLIKTVEEICNSLIHHGFKKILIINGHRVTNLSPLIIAAMTVHQKTGAFLAVIDPVVIAATVGMEMRRSDIGGLGHGGEIETSHMLYLYPDLVDLSDTKKVIPEYGSEMMNLDFYAGGDKVAWTFDVETLSNGRGCFGDPTLSSKEQGKEYHRRVVEKICDFIGIVKKMDVKLKEARSFRK